MAKITVAGFIKTFLSALDAAAARVAIGLGNVSNTSDANKPVSTAQQAALDLKANLASPALTGVPTAPTAAAGTATTQIANTAFVATAIGNLIDSAPGALNTLNELAAALGDDANFAATVTAALVGKLDADEGALASLMAVDPDLMRTAMGVAQDPSEEAAGMLNVGMGGVRLKGVDGTARLAASDGYIVFYWDPDGPSPEREAWYLENTSLFRVAFQYDGTGNRLFVLPDQSGTMALAENCLALTGAQTVAGAKTFTTSPTSNGTPTTQEQIANRTQTRMDWLRSVSVAREITPGIYVYSTSGTGSAATAGGFALSSGTTANAWQRAALVREWAGNPGSTGANNPCNIPVAFALAFFASTEAVANTSEIRFVVGDSGAGAPPAIGANALSGRGFGMRIYYSAANSRQEIRLFAHDGTTYAESAGIAFTGSLSQLASAIISNDAAGNVKLFLNITASSAGLVGSEASITLAGGPSSGNYGGAWASALTLNGAAGPTGQSLFRGISTRLQVGQVY